MNFQELPHDQPAEEIALGSMLRDEQTIPAVRDLVRPEDFFFPSHQQICQAIFDQAEARKPSDLAGVTMMLRDRGQLEELGGQDKLDGLFDNTPSPIHAKHYAGIVRDKAVARRLIALCERAGQEVRDPQADVGGMLASFQADVYDLSRRSDGEGVVDLGEAVEAALQRAGRVFEGKEPPGLMTGFPMIDRAIGGFNQGDLITLAADTSAGKTALAGNIAQNIATDGGTVLFVTREMNRLELGKRFLQATSGIAGGRIKFAKTLRPDDWQALQAATGQLSRLKIVLDSRSGTVADVALSARRQAAKWRGPLSLIILDYLQLMDFSRGQYKRQENTAQAVGRFAWGCKQLSMDLGTPVLLLSQLNRQGVIQDRPPTMHSLKESGDIENHSNAVILLYRPPDQAEQAASRTVWVRVAKARDGSTTPWQGSGEIRLQWKPSITRFEPAS